MKPADQNHHCFQKRVKNFESCAHNVFMKLTIVVENNVISLLIWLHSEGENMLIQISWLLLKPADLDHHCFQKRAKNF